MNKYFDLGFNYLNRLVGNVSGGGESLEGCLIEFAENVQYPFIYAGAFVGSIVAISIAATASIALSTLGLLLSLVGYTSDTASQANASNAQGDPD